MKMEQREEEMDEGRKVQAGEEEEVEEAVGLPFKEIKEQQNAIQNAIPGRAFYRLVKEVLREHADGYPKLFTHQMKITKGALDALQAGVEAYIVNWFLVRALREQPPQTPFNGYAADVYSLPEWTMHGLIIELLVHRDFNTKQSPWSHTGNWRGRGDGAAATGGAGGDMVGGGRTDGGAPAGGRAGGERGDGAAASGGVGEKVREEGEGMGQHLVERQVARIEE
ncbi:hypothetical protein BDZ91DRAFT_836991 [Kalaharituber pfeilii]|nr:hypothetical protein BDZ91DRAFT_836991 [Kalaharituber pfeilii]